jgi:hypothetical protein
MLYLSSTADVAIAELGDAGSFSVGRFAFTRSPRVLDLANLAPIPGMFSAASREEIFGLRFLHEFSNLISQPVERDKLGHIEYVPTQVLTEFLRDYVFKGGRVDGIRYKSAALSGGVNLVIFATQRNLVGGLLAGEHDQVEQWIHLQEADQVASDGNP